MKKLICLLVGLMLSSPAMAQSDFEPYVSGVDDTQGGRESKLDKPARKLLWDSVLNYYKDPKPEKVDTLLDLMASTDMLTRKTAWAPLVGFLTVVFPANKDHVMRWMSRNDYNTHAQYVIVNALMHAGMKESALLFAKAHRWEGEDMIRLRDMNHKINLKNLPIVMPGHIDTLWGAFFASGDTVYVEQIIEAMLTEKTHSKELNNAYYMTDDADPTTENKALAAMTLRDYARDNPPVREAIEKRLNAETKGSSKYELYRSILDIK